jgi:hypothetical protein
MFVNLKELNTGSCPSPKSRTTGLYSQYQHSKRQHVSIIATMT